MHLMAPFESGNVKNLPLLQITPASHKYDASRKQLCQSHPLPTVRRQGPFKISHWLKCNDLKTDQEKLS